MPIGGEGAVLYPHIKTVRQYYPNQKYNKGELVFNYRYIYECRYDGVINDEPRTGVNQSWKRVTHPEEYYTMFLQLGDNQDVSLSDANKTVIVEYTQSQNKLELKDYNDNLLVEASTNYIPFTRGESISGWYFFVNGLKIPNWGVNILDRSGSPEDGNFHLKFSIQLKYNTKDDTLHGGSYIECLCNMY